MKNERKLLKIMFNEVDFSEINRELRLKINQPGNNYFATLLNMYKKYSFNVFEGYSNSEINRIVNYIFNTFKNPFMLIKGLAEEFLELDESMIYVKSSKIFEWRDISYLMTEEVFKCAFVVDKKGFDLESLLALNNTHCIHMKTPKSDDETPDYADNHFHYGGKAGSFEYNWAGIMNRYNIMADDLLNWEKALADDKENLVIYEKAINSLDDWEKQTKKYQDSLSAWEKSEEVLFNRMNNNISGQPKWSLRQKLFLASMYRFFMFAFLKKEEWHEIYSLIESYENGNHYDSFQNDIEKEFQKFRCKFIVTQSAINQDPSSEKDLDDVSILTKLEYCLFLLEDNNQEHFTSLKNYDLIPYGEQLLLLRAFQTVLKSKPDSLFIRIFYQYLVIKIQFRCEFVLLNGRYGLENFNKYNGNTVGKTVGIKLYDGYSKLSDEYGIEKVLDTKYLASLEMRSSKNAIENVYRDIAIKKRTSADNVKKFDKIYPVAVFNKKKEGNPNSKQAYKIRDNINRKEAKKTFDELMNYISYHASSYKNNPFLDNFIIRGIDTISEELNCRPEVFAPYYRSLINDNGFLATYHIGEEFWDITDGLRAIDELIYFMGYKKGCRIGHGLVLGLNVRDYYAKKHQLITLTKQELLDNLCWLKKRVVNDDNLDSWIELGGDQTILSLYSEIYHDAPAYDETSYFFAWLMRGDHPDCIKEVIPEFDYRLNSTPFRETELNWQSIRDDDSAKEIHKLYLLDYETWKKGNILIEFIITDEYLNLVEIAQEYMIQKVKEYDIAIEANPTSNLKISTFDNYREHPIFKLKDKGLKVSINTDDPGIVNTTIENELQLMYAASKENNKDADQWIQEVINEGIQQSWC